MINAGLSANGDVLTAEQAAANFGDNRFRIVSLDVAFKDPYFQIVNTFMLNG